MSFEIYFPRYNLESTKPHTMNDEIFLSGFMFKLTLKIIKGGEKKPKQNKNSCLNCEVVAAIFNTAVITNMSFTPICPFLDTQLTSPD